jgi:hypothetical protein
LRGAAVGPYLARASSIIPRPVRIGRRRRKYLRPAEAHADEMLVADAAAVRFTKHAIGVAWTRTGYDAARV